MVLTYRPDDAGALADLQALGKEDG